MKLVVPAFTNIVGSGLICHGHFMHVPTMWRKQWWPRQSFSPPLSVTMISILLGVLEYHKFILYIVHDDLHYIWPTCPSTLTCTLFSILLHLMDICFLPSWVRMAGLSKTVNRAPIAGGGRFRHNFHSSVCPL